MTTTSPPSTNNQTTTTARLALEDGTTFTGTAFGALTNPQSDQPSTVTGEVVFNTAMTGYQEALTDPSYAGQILTMTTPLVGNYGINDTDLESDNIQVRGFVIRELSRIHSNYRADNDLSAYLKKAGILGIANIDTRALTRRIRSVGTLRGVLTCDSKPTNAQLVEQAIKAPNMAGANFVESLTNSTPPNSAADWHNGLGEWAERQLHSEPTDAPLKVVALDCGAKQNILRHLQERGCEVIVLPHNTTPEKIQAQNPDGLFISNGPGDPAAVQATIELLSKIAGTIPTFGICLGNQLLCLALGGKTFKLKFGHRGANQPVKNLLTNRIEITSQNHGFAVDPDSLTEETGCVPFHQHLNDDTLAGFRHLTKPIFAVQYHPEASPGPHDSTYLFDLFIHMMRTKRPINEADLQTVQPQLT